MFICVIIIGLHCKYSCGLIKKIITKAASTIWCTGTALFNRTGWSELIIECDRIRTVNWILKILLTSILTCLMNRCEVTFGCFFCRNCESIVYCDWSVIRYRFDKTYFVAYTRCLLTKTSLRRLHHLEWKFFFFRPKFIVCVAAIAFFNHFQ